MGGIFTPLIGLGIVVECEPIASEFSHLPPVKKKLEGMGDGVEVESEAGRGECDHGQPDDSDDVIGPPLPPGYNVIKRA